MITIYHFVKNGRDEVVHRFVVPVLAWRDTDSIKLGSTSVATDRQTIVRINDLTGYVEPNSLSDPTTQWTIKKGDIVVRGVHEEVIELPSDLEVDYRTISSVTSIDYATSPELNALRLTGK